LIGTQLVKGRKIFPCFKVWLGKDQDYVLGEGGASLLKAIEKYGSISEAARRTGVSYRYAWGQLVDMEKVLGQTILRTSKGGITGGGAELTEAALALLENYDRTKRYVRSVLKDQEYWEAIGLKMSARNRIKGTVESVEKDGVTSKVKMKIETPVIITAVITKEAVEDLEIRPGDKVEAVIKSTEVMVAKE
jgi:molybdate transport system regulatory protein